MQIGLRTRGAERSRELRETVFRLCRLYEECGGRFTHTPRDKTRYDAKHKNLVNNKAEAETVRTIFRRYLKLGSFSKLVAATIPLAKIRDNIAESKASHGEARFRAKSTRTGSSP